MAWADGGPETILPCGGVADSANSQVLPQTHANHVTLVDRLEWLFDSLPLCLAPNTRLLWYISWSQWTLREQRTLSLSQTDTTPVVLGLHDITWVKPPPSHKQSHFDRVFVSPVCYYEVL